jgi:hypothetical protein
VPEAAAGSGSARLHHQLHRSLDQSAERRTQLRRRHLPDRVRRHQGHDQHAAVRQQRTSTASRTRPSPSLARGRRGWATSR